jgi:hypothetical protein
MLIENQKISIRWYNHYKKHYEKLGYKFTREGDFFVIDVKHLKNSSDTRVEYICDYCHGRYKKSYKDMCNSRKNGGKDCCSNSQCREKKKAETRLKTMQQKGESLANQFPELAKQWHQEKNVKTPHEYRPFSNKKAWWVGECGHEWEASIDKRSKYGRGCPYCAGRSVDLSNCLFTIRPDIAQQWHTNKNSDLTPYDVTFRTGRSVWWKCENGHEWKSKISNRTNGSGCPVCGSSKGEKIIAGWLTENKIKFIREYYFEDLLGVGGEKLRFDFGVLDNKKNLLGLVEFDGIFHFRKIYHEDTHELIVVHDKRKNLYCTERNIKLLRIPYTKIDKTEDILKEELKEWDCYD